MTRQNFLIFGENQDEEAQILTLIGAENDELLMISPELKQKLYKIHKELIKFNIQLELINGQSIKEKEIS